jgi:hypothetical protein
MDLPEFTQSLEIALKRTGQPFHRFAVLTFVADCWSLIDDDPDPEKWVPLFLDAHTPTITE